MPYLFVLATLRCFFELFASLLIKLVTKWYCSESKEDQIIRQELMQMKKDINSISMVDEFSKYAKLQRKYNKLEATAKEKRNSRIALRLKLKLSLHYGIRILNAIYTSILLILYRSEPVIIFPKGYLWPLDKILCWPSSAEHCISLPSWIVLTEMSILSKWRSRKS